MISFSSLSKRRGAMLAGVFSLALSCAVLLCGAGSVPIENLLPQGAMQGDLNAGGHNLTNAATVSATNVVVSGSLTAPASFTLPFSQLTSVPTTLGGYGITDPVVLTSGSYANPAWLTSLAYSKLSGAPSLATVATSGAYNDLTGKPTLGTLAALSPTGTAGGSTYLRGDDSWATLPAAYTLTVATTSALGGVIVPASGGLAVDGSGNVSISAVPWSVVTGAPAFITSSGAPVQSVAGRTGAIVLSASDVSGLATVATLGSYNDLTSKPTIPAAQVNSDWNSSSGLSQILNKPALAASATTDTTNAGNITSGTLAAARVATLNQNTTGSAGSFTGSLSGDVTGTQSATAVGKVNGTSLAGLATGLLKNTTSTGVPSIAVAGTDYPGLTTANTFNLNQTAPGFWIPTGPSIYATVSGDSRIAGPQGIGTSATYWNLGSVDRLAGQLQYTGFYANSNVSNCGTPGKGVQDMINGYSASSFTTTANITAGSNTVTVTGSTSGITGQFGIGGPGILPGTYGTISGSTITLATFNRSSVPPITSTTGATIDINTNVLSPGIAPSQQTPHELSPAITGRSGGHFISCIGINDVQTESANCTMVNGSATFTSTSLGFTPPPGYDLSGSGFAAGTTVSSISYTSSGWMVTASNNWTGSSGTASITVTPVVSAWETAYTTLVNDALADNYIVIICTIPKAWAGPWLTGDSFRTTFNSWLLSTYGTTSLGNGAYSGSTSNVYVVDAASMSIWGSNNNAYYAGDGLHFTTEGEGLWASYINNAVSTIFPSELTGAPQIPTQSYSIPWNWIGPINQFAVDTGNLEGIYTFGNTSVTAVKELYLGNIYWQNFNGTPRMISGSNIVSFPLLTGTLQAGNPTQTTVSGSTSGTVVFSEPFVMPAYKKVVLYCNAVTGTASYTFPTAFTNTPVVLTTSGPAASVVTTLTTTSVTVTGASTTGPIIMEGY